MAFLIRARIVGSLLMAIGWGLASSAEAQDVSLEYAVKANYLYKFTPFVEWPARAFATPGAAFSICIVGQDPFRAALDEAVRGQTVGGRPIAVRRMAVVEPGAPCHLLFIGRSPTQSLAAILRAVAGQPVLTVTDRSRGVEGGMIQFVMQDGKVRFDVDPRATQSSDIKISSKLLDLAISRRRAAP